MQDKGDISEQEILGMRGGLPKEATYSRYAAAARPFGNLVLGEHGTCAFGRLVNTSRYFGNWRAIFVHSAERTSKIWTDTQEQWNMWREIGNRMLVFARMVFKNSRAWAHLRQLYNCMV